LASLEQHKENVVSFAAAAWSSREKKAKTLHERQELGYGEGVNKQIL
jgi:hypothetical protein